MRSRRVSCGRRMSAPHWPWSSAAAVITIPAVFDLSRKGDGRTIKVEGQQWWWQFSYDIDEDGFPDIVTANYRDRSMSLLLGVGDGSFKDTVTTSKSLRSVGGKWVPEDR